ETTKRETAPGVVRTEPTASRTDVPLNAIILIVFSSPISLPSAQAGIHLQANGSPVQGTVVIDGTNPAIIDLRPVSALQPATVYRLDIDASVADLVGNSLGTAT